MTNDPSTIVRTGYDKVAERHLEWKRSIVGDPSRRFLEELANRLPDNANGAVDSPDWTGEWLDVPMFFSSYDADTNRNSLRAAGFTLLLDEVVTMQEPEGKAIFLWVLAQKA